MQRKSGFPQLVAFGCVDEDVVPLLVEHDDAQDSDFFVGCEAVLFKDVDDAARLLLGDKLLELLPSADSDLPSVCGWYGGLVGAGFGGHPVFFLSGWVFLWCLGG